MKMCDFWVLVHSANAGTLRAMLRYNNKYSNTNQENYVFLKNASVNKWNKSLFLSTEPQNCKGRKGPLEIM